MNRLSVVGVLALCACGPDPSRATAVVSVEMKPETPIVVTRGASVTRTFRVTAIDLQDRSEVPGVTVTPECHLVPAGRFRADVIGQTTTCSFSSSSVVTPAELMVTITTTDAVPLGERIASLNMRFHAATVEVATLSTGGREITVTE